MKVDVHFWGVLRRVVSEQRRMELPDGSTVGELAALLGQSAELAREIRACAFSIGLDLVPRSHVLRDGDRIDVLPPVAGG